MRRNVSQWRRDYRVVMHMTKNVRGEQPMKSRGLNEIFHWISQNQLDPWERRHLVHGHGFKCTQNTTEPFINDKKNE